MFLRAKVTEIFSHLVDIQFEANSNFRWVTWRRWFHSLMCCIHHLHLKHSPCKSDVITSNHIHPQNVNRVILMLERLCAIHLLTVNCHTQLQWKYYDKNRREFEMPEYIPKTAIMPSLSSSYLQVSVDWQKLLRSFLQHPRKRLFQDGFGSSNWSADSDRKFNYRVGYPRKKRGQ